MWIAFISLFITTVTGLCHDTQTEIEGVCYKFFTLSYTYDEAQAHCIQEGGSLPIIHSKVQNNAVAKFGVETWIGLKNDPPEWENGDDVTYSLFDGFNKGAGCYTIQRLFFTFVKWLNRECTSKFQFSCMLGISLPTPATVTTGFSCPYIEKVQYEFAGVCYKFDNLKLTYEEAQAHCIQEGGMLPVIHSIEVNNAVRDVGNAGSNGNYNWISLIDDSTTLKWANGEALTFSRLADTHLSGSGKCFVMELDDPESGQWKRDECEQMRKFTCVLGYSPPTPATVTTDTPPQQSANPATLTSDIPPQQSANPATVTSDIPPQQSANPAIVTSDIPPQQSANPATVTSDIPPQQSTNPATVTRDAPQKSTTPPKVGTVRGIGRTYIRHSNKKLKADVIRTISNIFNHSICMLKFCDKESECLAINYNAATKDCQLLSSKSSSPSNTLASENDWNCFEVLR